MRNKVTCLERLCKFDRVSPIDAIHMLWPTSQRAIFISSVHDTLNLDESGP